MIDARQRAGRSDPQRTRGTEAWPSIPQSLVPVLSSPPTCWRGTVICDCVSAGIISSRAWMAEVRILRGACVPSLELGRRDQVAHCPRLATTTSTPPPPVWMPPPPGAAFPAGAQSLVAKTRSSSPPAYVRLSPQLDWLEVRPRDCEAEKKSKSFPFSSSLSKRRSEDKVRKSFCWRRSKERERESVEKCSLPPKHCNKQRSGRKAGLRRSSSLRNRIATTIKVRTTLAVVVASQDDLGWTAVAPCGRAVWRHNYWWWCGGLVCKSASWLRRVAAALVMRDSRQPGQSPFRLQTVVAPHRDLVLGSAPGDIWGRTWTKYQSIVMALLGQMYEAPSPSTRQSAFPVIAMSPKAKGHLRYVGLKSEFSPKKLAKNSFFYTTFR